MGGILDLIELYSDQIPPAWYGKFPVEPVRVKLEAPGVLPVMNATSQLYRFRIRVENTQLKFIVMLPVFRKVF